MKNFSGWAATNAARSSCEKAEPHRPLIPAERHIDDPAHSKLDLISDQRLFRPRQGQRERPDVICGDHRAATAQWELGRASRLRTEATEGAYRQTRHRALTGWAGCKWHTYGMTRTRLSTTVDRQLLDSARDLRPGSSDAALIDEALNALLRRHSSAEVDASYAAYDEHPLDEPDEWGDLASFRRVAAAS